MAMLFDVYLNWLGGQHRQRDEEWMLYENDVFASPEAPRGGCWDVVPTRGTQSWSIRLLDAK